MWQLFRLRSRGVIPTLALVILAAGAVAHTPAADPTVRKGGQPLLTFDKPVTIVCLGDSVTGVYYHTGGWGAYPEMLRVALQRLHPHAKITVINAGISGQSADHGLARLEKDVLSKKPDLVTVSFCLNDVTRFTAEAYKQNLVETVNRCRAAQSQVVLCTPNAVVETGGRPRSKLVQFCEVIHQVGRELAVPVCDQYAAGEAHRKRDALGWRLTLSDEIHPNMDGHKLMAEELCKAIDGKTVSLAAVGPLAPALKKTVSLLDQKKPVRVLAMPPYDTLIVPALQAKYPDAKVEVTVWQTAGKSLDELQKEANATVRKMAPDLVVLAVPRAAAGGPDEPFANSYTWVMNWSLSFGYMEWDCFAVHPSVTAPETQGPRDDLKRQLIRAQHLHFIDRQPENQEPAAVLFNRWLVAAIAEASKTP